jgi:endoglucanase
MKPAKSPLCAGLVPALTLLVATTLTAPPALASASLQSWQSAPWNGMTGQTTLSATVTDPAFQGGTSFVFTISDARTGVNVSTPANPDFTLSSPSFFGFESSGFGVGDATVGRFNTGESLTLQADRAFLLEQITWREFTGDETLHLRWIRNGATHSGVFPITAETFVFSDVLADANTPITVTNVSSGTANAAGRLRFNTIRVALTATTSAPATGATLQLQNWTSSPWNAVNGSVAFSGTVTDSVHGPTLFTFGDPRTGMDVSAPAAPNATPSAGSFFGFEGTGFGVGNSGLGRFDRGERFTLQSQRAFQLQAIRWAEYNGDEAVHIQWIQQGAAQSQVMTFSSGSFTTVVPVPGVYADANTPIVITNVSSGTANATGRLRINRVDVALLTNQSAPAPTHAGSQLVLFEWARWPWNLVSGATSFSGTLPAPENGGTPAVITWSNPRTGVNVNNPAAPDFTPAAASFFGLESTGFGVGNNGLGRFDRGESFTIQCGRTVKLEELMWREFTGDESLHFRWTAQGVTQQQVIPVSAARMELSNIVADANTPIIITNVSGTSANLTGRLRLEYAIARLMFPSAPTYPASGPNGFVQMSGVNLAGAEFGGFAFYPTEPGQLDYYQSKGLKLLRIPFKWERIQPSLSGALNASAMASLDTVIAGAQARGMKVVLDLHNYGRYGGDANVIGGTVPVNAFKDVWRRLAQRYAGNSAIYGYGIMNEPHGMNGAWPGAAQAAIDGIREFDSSTWIIVAGENWSSASSWRSSNANLNVSDPQNRVMYEAHCYFDSVDGSGNGSYGTWTAENPNPNVGVLRAAPFLLWLQERNARGFFGEYGIPKNDVRWNPILDRFLKYIFSNGTSGTYWAGGMHWNNYPLDCSPTNNYTNDAQQMEVLEDHVY